MRVAFVGLGVMGYPMAGHLATSGHATVVYNRTASKAERWTREFAGDSAPTPAAAAKAAEIVCVCVGNDDDLREVMYGPDGVLAALPTGGVVVDHTTASATVARELGSAAAERSLGFVDAPVSGGQAGAENGQLTIMLGGSEADVSRVEPVLQSYARAITHIGAIGSGQLCKMVNQICIAGVLQGLAEGLHFAHKAGLDEALVIEAISAGAAQSWQMENRWRTMVDGEFDFGFAVDWMRKDLGIALAEARDNGAQLDLTALVDGYYEEVQALGGKRWDTSALIARLPK
jgi:3-hydroxyisobutyrate dehydrogenase-like beta-hydroxyacid dehydrogenase